MNDHTLPAVGGQERSVPHDDPSHTLSRPRRPGPAPYGGMTPEAIRERIDQAIKHSDARLASSRAAVASSQLRAEVGKKLTDEVRAGLARSRALVRELEHQRPPPEPPPQPLALHDPAELRRQLVELALKFAATETRIAEHHESIAARLPGRKPNSLRIAAEARRGAERAQELARRFGTT